MCGRRKEGVRSARARLHWRNDERSAGRVPLHPHRRVVASTVASLGCDLHLCLRRRGLVGFYRCGVSVRAPCVFGTRTARGRRRRRWHGRSATVGGVVGHSVLASEPRARGALKPTFRRVATQKLVVFDLTWSVGQKRGAKGRWAAVMLGSVLAEGRRRGARA